MDENARETHAGRVGSVGQAQPVAQAEPPARGGVVERAEPAAQLKPSAQPAAQVETSAQEGQGCTCHHKETPRSAEFQADLQRRLNRAIGQLNGVKGMLDDNRYCGDVLIQLAAAESAIRSVSSMLLQDHLETCVVEQIRRGNDEVVEEVVQLIKRFAC